MGARRSSLHANEQSSYSLIYQNPHAPPMAGRFVHASGEALWRLPGAARRELAVSFGPALGQPKVSWLGLTLLGSIGPQGAGGYIAGGVCTPAGVMR